MAKKFKYKCSIFNEFEKDVLVFFKISDVPDFFIQRDNKNFSWYIVGWTFFLNMKEIVYVQYSNLE